MAVDYAKVEAQNRREFRIGTMTLGDPSDPCVIIPPGSGSLKSMSLFWARELAQAGPFFVILYDLRCTGESERMDLDQVFGPFGTTAGQELKRVFGMREESDDEEGTKKPDAGAGVENLRTINTDYEPPAGIMEQLFDTDAHVLDAVRVLDQHKIEKAHVMGLSQGGMLAMNIALQAPERVLTCVPCAPAMDESSAMLGCFAQGADDFFSEMKKLGKPPKFTRSSTKKEYVDWWVPMLEVLIPGGFPREMFVEMVELQYDAGFMTDDDSGVQALAYRNFSKAGKHERRDQQLKQNKVPMMVVHGKKDPVLYYQHGEKLFRMAANCVFTPHEYGHNFGPPEHQHSMMRMIATWMKKHANCAPAAAPERVLRVGGDTHAAGVSADLGVTAASELKQIYDKFCQVQTAADVGFVFDLLLEKLQLQHLKGRGVRLYSEISAALKAPSAGLSFKQKRLVQELDNSLARQHKVVARIRRGDTSTSGPSANEVKEAVQATIKKYFPDAPEDATSFNKVLICGAGPVGLRVGCELALLGFDVHVAEKRANFSRANILTFWDGTMADMMALGVKSYFPDLQASGNQKFLGTRQIQVCLLKTLLLLGGRVEYGCEICGLVRPAAAGSRWRANFRVYVKGRRTAETEFQKSKDYAADGGTERSEVDEAFLSGGAADATTSADFDAYVIAEGGWSDSTARLGFDKLVETFKPVFGLVINVNYNVEDMKEKNLKSQVHFCLSGDFPLQLCKIKTEFIEYLKGETHFFALVVSKVNLDKDMADRHLANMEAQDREAVPQAMIDAIRFGATRKGLLELGVFKESKPTGRELLAESNLDKEKLYEMARLIVTEMGLPETAQFYETNPVQLFDFSRRARCIHSVRVLTSAGQVEAPGSYAGTGKAGAVGDALVLPVGDALQEPNWTEGTGVNRGFHTGMNQAFACLVARESGLKKGIQESVRVQDCVLKTIWGGGNSGLAGGGGNCKDLKPFKEWNSDPRSRLSNYK